MKLKLFCELDVSNNFHFDKEIRHRVISRKGSLSSTQIETQVIGWGWKLGFIDLDATRSRIFSRRLLRGKTNTRTHHPKNNIGTSAPAVYGRPFFLPFSLPPFLSFVSVHWLNIVYFYKLRTYIFQYEEAVSTLTIVEDKLQEKWWHLC